DFHNEELLYNLFGVNAQLLIDHAWGWEPVTMELVKAYKPETNSLSSGQVLQHPYDFAGGKLIVREMTDLLVLDMVDKKLVTDQMVLTIGYDIENLADPKTRGKYKGEITTDHYGRKVPKHAHGTANLGVKTSSTRKIMDAVMELYDRIVDPDLSVRRVTVAANRLVDEAETREQQSGQLLQFEQLDLFTDYAALEKEKEAEGAMLARERKLQEAMLTVKKKYGKNAILKGTNLQEGAMTMERNRQIGGHKA
ncbi:MAG: DNA methylase, partial [Acetatifactor sp.]|nr:DNA methylase [Acetatifactor sp.]